MFLIFLLIFSTQLLFCAKCMKLFKKKEETNASSAPTDFSQKPSSSGSAPLKPGKKNSHRSLKKKASEKKFKFAFKMGGDDEEVPETDLRSVDDDENPLAKKEIQAKLRTGGLDTKEETTKTEAGSKAAGEKSEASVILSQPMKMENEPYRANQSIYISTKDIKKKSKESKENATSKEKAKKEEKKEEKKEKKK